MLSLYLNNGKGKVESAKRRSSPEGPGNRNRLEGPSHRNRHEPGKRPKPKSSELGKVVDEVDVEGEAYLFLFLETRALPKELSTLPKE